MSIVITYNKLGFAILRLSFIANEQKIRDRQISSLNDRLVELLNSQTSIFLMMERMKNALDAQCTYATKNFITMTGLIKL